MMVQTTQIRADRRLRHSAWYTALCMVKLEETRTAVKKPALAVSRTVPAGGKAPTVLPRMVKKAANSPLKNISSEPSQIMTPMASIGGRSWMIFPWGAGTSAETAWVTGEFLVDLMPNTPTKGSGERDCE